MFSLIFAKLWPTLLLNYVQRMTAYCIGFRVRSFDITVGVYLFSTEARGTNFGNDLNRDRLTVQYNPCD